MEGFNTPTNGEQAFDTRILSKQLHRVQKRHQFLKPIDTDHTDKFGPNTYKNYLKLQHKKRRLNEAISQQLLRHYDLYYQRRKKIAVTKQMYH